MVWRHVHQLCLLGKEILCHSFHFEAHRNRCCAPFKHHSFVQIGFSPWRDAVATRTITPPRGSFDTLATIPTFLLDACLSPQKKRGTGIDTTKPPQRVITSEVGPADFEKPTILPPSCLSSPLDTTLGSPGDATKAGSSHLMMEKPTPAASVKGRRKTHMNHHLFHHFRTFLNLDSSSVSSISDSRGLAL